MKLHIPNIPGVSRETIERMVRSKQHYCQRCKEFVRDSRTVVDASRRVVIVSGTCGCGFREIKFPVPK